MPSKRNRRTRKHDRPFEWMLASNKRLDRQVAVIGERIILFLLRHPSLNISFTINRWAHFVAMLQDINEAARLRPLERKATGRRRVSFCKHLDDGIYITAVRPCTTSSMPLSFHGLCMQRRRGLVCAQLLTARVLTQFYGAASGLDTADMISRPCSASIPAKQH